MTSLDRRGSALGLALALMVVAGCSGAASTVVPATATPAPTTTDYVADLDVGGGRTMHIVCLGPTGTGRPTVILEHGLGAAYNVWEMVLTGLQKTDRVCAYDRASETGQSPLPEGVRTTSDQVADLHALLAAAAIKPPYILAGHSIGGWNNLVFARDYPAEVAGVVFVDVRPPATTKGWLAALPKATVDEGEALKALRADIASETDSTKNPEHLDLAKSADEALAAAGFGDLPLIVLIRADASDEWIGLDPALTAKLVKVDADLRAGLVKLSTSSKLVKVANTSHEIQVDQPQAVIDAILEVLGKAG